jgi:hypothetical protein
MPLREQPYTPTPAKVNPLANIFLDWEERAYLPSVLAVELGRFSTGSHALD